MWSSPSWWEEPLRIELADLMDDLDDGWAGWRPPAEPDLG